jgi:hypothetical protein
MAWASARTIAAGTALAMTVSAMNAAAEAAQGPGVTAGTASAAVQTTMAIAIYGMAAAIVMAAAVLGLMRRR